MSILEEIDHKPPPYYGGNKPPSDVVPKTSDGDDNQFYLIVTMSDDAEDFAGFVEAVSTSNSANLVFMMQLASDLVEFDDVDFIQVGKLMKGEQLSMNFRLKEYLISKIYPEV